MLTDEEKLRQVFVACDVGWLFDQSPMERARQYLKEMREVDVLFRSTFGRTIGAPVADLIFQNPIKWKPLVQAFAAPMTTPIRTMIVCVLDGAQIKSVKFDYQLKRHSRLEIEIQYESGEHARFDSDNLWDVEVLRHFGLMKMGQAPIIDGYYAFRKG